MTIRKHDRFTKESLPRPSDAHPDCPTEPEPYVARDELVEAVNLAIHLRRPLLLEGEAGCGKTRLARAVAYQLGLPYYEWPVRSTSKVQEGLYSYDAIGRLHDVQVSQLEAQLKGQSQQPATGPGGDADKPARPKRDPSEPKDYRKFGALGKAFRMRDCPAVVLIDEIDKADIDFPNDLLTILDRPWEFTIPETYETVTAAPDCLPIVFITSNKEKGNLPAPFLRRCIYFFIEFPDKPERLKEIVQEHYRKREGARTTQRKAPPGELIDASIQRFLDVRAQGDLYKKPGTSELLDWLEALRSFVDRPYPHATLANPKSLLPYPNLLFKLKADWQRYRMAP